MYDQITHHLNLYLTGRTTLTEFRDWFAPVLWTIEQSGDSDSVGLAYAIELRHSELRHGHVTEDEFRRELAALPQRASGAFSHG